MKQFTSWVALTLMIAVLLCGCAKQTPGASGGLELVEDQDTRLISVTLESSVTQLAIVTLFPMTEEDGSYTPGQAQQAVFDGVDTHYLVVDSGGAYGLKVTTELGREIQFLLMLDESRVCSFHICLDEKEDTGYRHLWPETPHNNREPN